MAKHVTLLAGHGAQVLDITGPAAVFSAANDARPDRPPYQVDVASPDGGLIETISSVALNSKAIGEIDPKRVDTMLVAGHQRPGMLALIRDKRAKEWTCSVSETARRWGSVCSGSFALAAWGLLNGKTATTHWANITELAERYPSTDVDPDALYVTDGHIWTSAGVTAGVDMSLAMVEEDLGTDIAAEIARRLVLYLRRPGGQSQFSTPMKRQCDAATPYDDVIRWAKANLHTSLSITVLAEKAGQTTRTFQRHFKARLGQSPAAYIETLRIERAKALIQSDVKLKTVAADLGYTSASQLTSVFRRRVGLSPSVWKTMHGTGRAV